MQRENMKFFAIAIVTAFGFLLATVPLASAQNAFQCTGTIADGRTIDSNLVVPANKTCELDNVRVAGNVQVGTGATLNALPGSGQMVTIGGNIVADQCLSVDISVAGGGTISLEGNVKIQNCTTPNSYVLAGLVVHGNLSVDDNNTETGTYFVEGVVVQGNLSVDNNNSENTLILESNQVSGNVDFSGNSAMGRAPPFVDGNKISGNLSCSGNSPPPVGASNTVGGREQGQCAALEP
jgi:hypothetical protein